MRVDRGIARRARQVLVFPVRYVLMCARIAILLREAKINNIHEIAFPAEAHEEIV